MPTTQLIILIFATAFASSSLTSLALLLVLRRMAPRLMADQLGRSGDELAVRVHTAVIEAGEVLLPRFREEVEAGLEAAAGRVTPNLESAVGKGLEEAAERVLPKIRAEVDAGVRNGLVAAMDPRILKEAGAKAGSSVLEAGLNMIFGKGDE